MGYLFILYVYQMGYETCVYFYTIDLLMGEIPRLSDSIEGYGPNGKDYIAHVDIPIEVETAFMELKKEYAGMVREANPLYASTK